MRALWIVTLALAALGAKADVVLTTLHSFQRLFTNGKGPNGLVRDSNGNFYGTTASGGTNGYGTVFRISADGTLTNLYSFTGKDGVGPLALVQSSDGYFYGTTQSGGASGSGTFFRISTNGALTSLHSFTGGSGSSGGPIVQGADGNFYGTGGGLNYGTVFRISPNGILTTLHSFTGGQDGGIPYAGLVQGSDGNFYGTTYIGGVNQNYSDEGTVFKISTNGALTTLYAFTGGTDGANPGGGLMQGSDGSLYGTTSYGGSGNRQAGSGTVFKITTDGVLTSLYTFTGGSDGAIPWAALVQGSDGNLYGTTKWGGADLRYAGYGTVFQISTDGALTTLHSFNGTNDGSYPVAALTQSSDGNFYGATPSGDTDGAGMVFKISTDGIFSGFYSFAIGLNDGANPKAGLVRGNNGNLLGTTSGGGAGFGTVFMISTNGALTSLYSFTGGDNGAGPNGLVQGTDGNLYGTTSSGGASPDQYGNRRGTVFKITPGGALTSLYSFTSGGDGGIPNGGLVQGGDGNFYGTTAHGGTYTKGTVFRISADGMLTNLYSFTGKDGAGPAAALVQGDEGNFYGTTVAGGTYTNGTLFVISTNGVLTSLYSFSGGKDGGTPNELVQSRDGNFYGTTAYGGDFGNGTIFRIEIPPPPLPPVNVIHSGETVQITWPTSAGNAVLEMTDPLSPAVWVPVGITPGSLGDQMVVTVNIESQSRFFRLRKP